MIGGGVTGLAAAYFLSRSRPGTEITLLESSDRLGGKVLTRTVRGAFAETGPDSIVARNTLITELCHEIGLSESIIHPKSSTSYLWARRKLRPLPPNIFAGYPSGGIGPLARSGIISLPGLIRMASEPLIPRTTVGSDISVGELTARRFGNEFKTKLVDPLIGGIMSCSSDELSAREILPQLYSIARDNRSVLTASRRARRHGPPPKFFSFMQGTSEIITRLDAATGGVKKLLNRRVEAILPDNGRWLVKSGTLEVESDALILTLPANAASSLLAKAAPELASILASFRYTSVATIVLAYDSADFNPGLEGSGFLVPEGEGLLMTGCSWLSSKWSNAEADRTALLRCFVGKLGDERWKAMSDEELVGRMQLELKKLINISGSPLETLVTRWESAFPVYGVGHRDLVSRARSLCPEGLYLAGAAYGGVGISSCIADAKAISEDLCERLGETA